MYLFIDYSVCVCVCGSGTHSDIREQPLGVDYFPSTTELWSSSIIYLHMFHLCMIHINLTISIQSVLSFYPSHIRHLLALAQL